MQALAASDPSLAWKTIETVHFRITYSTGLDAAAERVADACESIYGDLAQAVGWHPKERTEIALSDPSERANGSATPLPYNAMSLLVTAPQDMSPLGDVDDWLATLVTHELTHILHTDQIRGLPAIGNAVLGKTFSPNNMQPAWILEGLAVYHESARTSGGRLRNSQWDMFMRTDVLNNTVATIDQISNRIRRWPQGNTAYLYGSFFTQWIAQTYGENALRAIAEDYGKQPIVWGINRSARRATGKTYVDLYPEWITHLQRRYSAQAKAIAEKGLREGIRQTHHGQITRYPRWIPANAWPNYENGLLYYRDDQHNRAGLWAIPLARRTQPNTRTLELDESRASLIARVRGESVASFAPDASLVFSAEEITKNVFTFSDLERIEPAKTSVVGLGDATRSRLTRGARASDPAISPDGKSIAFVVNRAGCRTLNIGTLDATAIRDARQVVESKPFEQAFTPRWSPDGTHVAYSIWKEGGYRDIRYVDVRDGSWQDLTHDRAVDGGPSFSPDGRFLFFHSDRTGVSNIYAWEFETQALRQVTNVRTGAFSPEPSPDGKTLAYVGYTPDGFDLFTMGLDESSWTEAEDYDDARPSPAEINRTPKTFASYTPLPTLAPRRFGLALASEGSFGRVFNITATQSDLLGFHSASVSLVVEQEKPELQGTVGYTYGRLPFDTSVSLFRSIVPQSSVAKGLRRPLLTQERVGVSSQVSYTQPSSTDAHTFVIGHNLARTARELDRENANFNPYEAPYIPKESLLSAVHVGYSYSNAEQYTWSTGFERGFSLNVSADFANQSLASDIDGSIASTNIVKYLPMPWLRHHTLALHTGGGTSRGKFPGPSAFYVGSFVDLPIIDTIRNSLVQGGLTLRGYPALALAGRHYALSNAEYRFPILNIDRGVSTLPVFINRITGTFFFDYGSAFDSLVSAAFKSGAGAEAWFDFTLGYVLPFTFRAGYARGLSSGGIDKTYVVAAVPY